MLSNSYVLFPLIWRCLLSHTVCVSICSVSIYVPFIYMSFHVSFFICFNIWWGLSFLVALALHF